ncbi:hypothetical protein AALP_AA7G246100, partial [Arabis alpina]
MDFIRKETIGHGSFSTVSLATTSKTSTSFPPLIAVKSTGVVYSAALINERNVLDSLGYCSEIVRCYGEGKTVENGEEIYNLFLEYASGAKPRSEAKPKSEIRGTPMYMAPESVSYGEFESPVDIWGDEIPEIPVRLSEEGKDFLKKCFVKNSSERWTAKMLLDHPFLAVDDGLVRVGLVSPRDPFDFPGWNSVQSPVKENLRFGDLVRLPEERISGLVTENGPDWSVMCDWVNV